VKRMISLFLVLAAVTLSVDVAGANPRWQRIRAREARQHARIRAGWRQGDLTRGERWRLRHGQAHVRRMARRARRDGALGRYERWRIARAQDRQSMRIYHLRHNRRERAI
jgi:hypothetical protein